MLVSATMLAMTILAACGGGNKELSLQFQGTDKGDVVATYKGGQVTQAEFDKYLDLFVVAQPAYEQIVMIPDFQKMILEQYVSYKVLSGQASEETLTQARKDADEQLKQFKEYVDQDESFKKLVKDKKVTDADMGTFLLLTTVVVAQVNSMVTDADMDEAYESMKANFGTYSVRHILVQTHEQDAATGEQKEVRTLEEALEIANEVKAKLDAGGDWNELAKQYSDDPGSKENGGLYENAKGSGWVESFKQAAFEQELNAVGEPFQSEFGYHVMKVEKRELPELDALTEDEKKAVQNTAAMNVMDKFMQEEMPKQELNITLPEPEPTEGADEGDAEGGAGAGNAEPTEPADGAGNAGNAESTAPAGQ
jgi:Parvulin-like peptidyl-prolyl isomerase